MKERRQQTRIQVSLPVLAATPGLDPPARITNISIGGAFIATTTPLEADTSLALDFQLPHDPERMTVNARVVWSKSVANATSPGMGIEFIDIPERHQQKLDGFIEWNM